MTQQNTKVEKRIVHVHGNAYDMTLEELFEGLDQLAHLGIRYNGLRFVVFTDGSGHGQGTRQQLKTIEEFVDLFKDEPIRTLDMVETTWSAHDKGTTSNPAIYDELKKACADSDVVAVLHIHDGNDRSQITGQVEAICKRTRTGYFAMKAERVAPEPVKLDRERLTQRS